ncbi:hypothetical protein QE361_003636 [Sphingomonas sp. SORGH_AS802]|uniref:hypothetical protein n=1 Tax=unclassified Sphingomonas TaxID=196159 RepID=UPI002857B7D7|nr:MULTISPECIES: hypothetical protein [unclassified Sphingomonas]MDR6125936.1 hypothetical protein [Sphingomonas sp. SORGH_AS_0438]MDR6136628.1 hypothetical protein [Sphingomonas sp. SORGH_AS_0802]
MASYWSGVRGRIREAVIVFAQTLPVFVIVSYISTPEKALVTTTVFFSIYTAVMSHWGVRNQRGFWLLVALILGVNIVVIWAIPITGKSPSGHAIAYPIGIAEGFAVYWLLGWWRRRGSSVG